MSTASAPYHKSVQWCDDAHDDTDPIDTVGRSMDERQGFTFTVVNSICASTKKVTCCHFSSDGKLLASGGIDKTAVLWCTNSLKQKAILEDHSSLITDVRFSPNMPRLATSSFDQTVRVWHVDNVESVYSLRTFVGHSVPVLSVDFHPNISDLICSCDGDGEIRYWIIKNGSGARFSKGGNNLIRFQPRLGRYLAAAAGNKVSIFDVETQLCRYSLKGHAKMVFDVCWDPYGQLLASVSADSVRVWTFESGNEGKCVHQLSRNDNEFHACSLELWNMIENKTMTILAHDHLITGLAVSTVNRLVASASHDKFIKLWK
ncbi:hypothetical protein VNO78_00959 [Psophocarpus tetragonolobus]|uniref:Uncharacterized protein n=1 Tax=Psophocarpus tetragonolobus TaxID=3891 RepID=A0AAN9SXJ3_PSOTE